MKKRSAHLATAILMALFVMLGSVSTPPAVADAALTFGDYDLVDQQGYNLALLKSLGELAIVEAYEQQQPEITKNDFRVTLPFFYGDIHILDFYASDYVRALLSMQNAIDIGLEDQAWACEGTISFKEVAGKGGIILVCFEGSNALSDWINNFTFLSDEDGIHKGFHKAARFFLDDYAELVTKRYQDYVTALGGCQIILTGHSLGGAMAQVVTYWLHQTYHIPKESLLTYTFASPNPFSQDVQTGEWNRVYNLRNPHDLFAQPFSGANAFGKSLGSVQMIPDAFAMNDTAIGENHTDAYLAYLHSLPDIAVPEQPSTELATETARYRELARGATGDDVRAVQRKLVELGYLHDKIDGKYGKKTAAAVRSYQKAQGFEETGVLTPEQQAALLGDNAYPATNDLSKDQAALRQDDIQIELSFPWDRIDPTMDASAMPPLCKLKEWDMGHYSGYIDPSDGYDAREGETGSFLLYPDSPELHPHCYVYVSEGGDAVIDEAACIVAVCPDDAATAFYQQEFSEWVHLNTRKSEPGMFWRQTINGVPFQLHLAESTGVFSAFTFVQNFAIVFSFKSYEEAPANVEDAYRMLALVSLAINNDAGVPDDAGEIYPEPSASTSEAYEKMIGTLSLNASNPEAPYRLWYVDINFDGEPELFYHDGNMASSDNAVYHVYTISGGKAVLLETVSFADMSELKLIVNAAGDRAWLYTTHFFDGVNLECEQTYQLTMQGTVLHNELLFSTEKELDEAGALQFILYRVHGRMLSEIEYRQRRSAFDAEWTSARYVITPFARDAEAAYLAFQSEASAFTIEADADHGVSAVAGIDYNPEQYPIFAVYDVRKDENGVSVTGTFGDLWMTPNEEEGIMMPEHVGFDTTQKVTFTLSDLCVPRMIDLYNPYDALPCDDLLAWFETYYSHTDGYIQFHATIALDQSNKIVSFVQYYWPLD